MTSSRSHQALYRRWRAQTFAQIVGQGPVVETLRNAVRTDHLAHALLFVGPRGTGKTSLARIVAKAINCLEPRDGEPCDRCVSCVAIREGRALDVVEMDAASNNRVDDIRELLPRIYTAPSDLRRKVFIVDEVQRIKEGWDLLLKTLEEPPDHVVFVFCTTDSSQIRPAVLSRVQRFDFRRLTVEEIEGKLRTILAADGRDADDEAVQLIARLAAGGMRDAESMLDQLLASGDGVLTADRVRALLGLAEAETVASFATALVDGDAAAGLAILADLEERGRDPRAFLDQVVDLLRAQIVERLAGGAGPRSLGPLAAAATRLAALDPTRAGPGGLRFQLELVLLAPSPRPGHTSIAPLATEPSRSSGAAAGSAPAVPGSRPDDDPAAAPTARRSAGRSGHRGASTTTEPTAGAESPPPAAAAELPTEPTRDVVAAPPLEPAATPSDDDATAGAAGTAGREPAPTPGPTTAAEEGSGQPDAAGSATESSAAAPGPGSDEGTLDALRSQWPEIVAYISQHPPTKPLIGACRPIGVEGAIVTLGFPEGQAFLKDVADRRRGNLEEGIGHFLGRPVTVRCVATNLDAWTELPTDDDGARLVAEARRIFADDLVDVGEVG